MIPYGFHPEAESELLDAIDYYESRSKGLGLDFALEVYQAIRSVCEHPQAWPILDGDVRRCLIKRFPYGVLYSVENDSALILAVMHLHMKPGYWKERKKR